MGWPKWNCGVVLALLVGTAHGELIHRYSFNDGTARDSVGGAHGTPVNGPIFRDGEVVFDPQVNNGTNSDPATGQYIDLPNGIAEHRHLTVEVWTTFRGGNPWQRIVDFGNCTAGELLPTDKTTRDYQGHGFLILTHNFGGGLLGQISIDSWGDPVDTDFSFGPGLSHNQEHHVVFVHDPDAGQQRLYLDGVLVGGDQATVDPSTSAWKNYFLGRSNFSDNPFYNGALNEVRLYDHGLSESGVIRNYLLGPDVVALVRIIDDGDSGFRSAGKWSIADDRGFQGDLRSSKTTGGSNTAEWVFSVTPGVYHVAATWAADSRWASRAPFAILDGVACRPVLVDRAVVDQRHAPRDFTADGANWDDLGIVNIFSNSLIVRLSGSATGRVVADAVRIERFPDLELPTVQVVDNGDLRFSTTGSWSVARDRGYERDYRWATKGSGSNTATWTFLVVPGQYEVAATWTPSRKWADAAPFTIYDGPTVLGTVKVNQQSAPDDFSEQGVSWKGLGTFAVTGNVLAIRLSAKSKAPVVADAIRIRGIEGAQGASLAR